MISKRDIRRALKKRIRWEREGDEEEEEEEGGKKRPSR